MPPKEWEEASWYRLVKWKGISMVLVGGSSIKGDLEAPTAIFPYENLFANRLNATIPLVVRYK